MIYTHVLKMGGVRSAAHLARWLLGRDHKADFDELLLLAGSRRSNHSTVRPLPSALRTQSASAMQTGSQSGIDPEPYSHSIINEPSKLLICRGLETDSALFTVTFTVNLI